MSWKNRGTTSRRKATTTEATASKRHCLIFFLLEGSHGVWPEHLIRSKGRFSFEAKYGIQWFECRIEKEGTMEECQTAQKLLEKSASTNEKQWSSADTELSEDEDSSDNSDEENTVIGITQRRKESQRAKKTTIPVKNRIDHSIDPEQDILKDISESISGQQKRMSTFDDDDDDEPASKKQKTVEKTTNERSTNDRANLIQSPSSNGSTSSDFETKVSLAVEAKLSELKKMMTKVYSMQKQASDGSKKKLPSTSSESFVVNNINLMSLPGKTASRFLLSAARVVLTNEQLTNGYLPDFRGDKTGRVPIPEESVKILKDAVRMRFAFKEEDMHSIWTSIRTSLVQKVSDVRKSTKRKSLQSIADQDTSSSPKQKDDVVCLDVNDNDNGKDMNTDR